MKNRPDGAVEAVFEGEPDAVEALVEYCRTGPRSAEVNRADVVAEPVRGERGFLVTG